MATFKFGSEATPIPAISSSHSKALIESAIRAETCTGVFVGIAAHTHAEQLYK